MRTLPTLLKEIRGCTLCAAHLPLGPRPIVQASVRAKIMIIGQAPGSRTHETGLPFKDASGKRLREWMGIDEATFYDAKRVAIMPMGFCYPGTGAGGDLPPRKECAPTWHDPLLALLRDIEVTLLIGQYAQARYLPGADKSVTRNVQAWEGFAPKLFPLPHPSPRNNIWLKQNPWFEREVVPVLQSRIAQRIAA